MEIRYAYSTKELFAKLRVFDVISDLESFQSDKNGRDLIIMKINHEQSQFWAELMTETLMNLHFKLVGKPLNEDVYGIYKWQNVYPPYNRLEVHLKQFTVAFHFQIEDSSYEFFNWIDDICQNACKIRNDPPEKFKETEDLFRLFQDQEEERDLRQIVHLTQDSISDQRLKKAQAVKVKNIRNIVYSMELEPPLNTQLLNLNAIKCRTCNSVNESLNKLCSLIDENYL